MPRSRDHRPTTKATDAGRALWPRVAQIFIGLFFVAAAYFKLTDSFFGARLVPLEQDIHYWLDSGFTLQGYREFLKFMLPYADFLASIVILGQGIVGILLIYNSKLKWAGVILFFIQLNVLLGSIYGTGFIVFSGMALWLAAFYFFRDRMRPWGWAIFTWALVALTAKYQHLRYIIGDPWLASFPQQYAHFQQDVMSVHPMLKQFVMDVIDPHKAIVQWIWASSWWIATLLLPLMLTRYRLYAGTGWLCIFIIRELVWTTAVTGEGTIYVLSYFTWVTFEEYFQRTHKPRLLLLPRWREIADAWRRLMLRSQRLTRLLATSPARFPGVRHSAQ